MNWADSAIVAEYQRRTPGSARWAAEAARRLPSGVAHDSRYLAPYPIYVERAAGSRKWDVDGNEYVDYSGGHGALLLGHNHPAVVAAVAAQLERGTHFGACHPLEVEWARRVQQLIPSAERVRFTSSGTEATLLALRLARSFTGKPKIVRLAGHFHGWHDHLAFAVANRFDGSAPPGVLSELARQIVVAPPGDCDAMRALLETDRQIAAVILEPTGASWGQVPLAASYVQQVRQWTAERGVLFIADEVITGFRCSPGGAQQVLGIRPDLTTLAKILAGGLPGGAVCGRVEVLAGLEFPPLVPPAAAASEPAREKISHHGTFNANPLSAAAGVATLDIVAQSDVCVRASQFAAELREALDRVLCDLNSPWCCYGSYSGFHLFTNPERLPIRAADIEAGQVDWQIGRAHV